MKGEIKMKKTVLIIFILICILISYSVPAQCLPINMDNLHDGDSFQKGDLYFDNWNIVLSNNVNAEKIEIGNGYFRGDEDIGVWPIDHELRVNHYDTQRLQFDYRVTYSKGSFDYFEGFLGYRRIRGYTYDSPNIQATYSLGSIEGGDDYGTATSYYSLGTCDNTKTINLPSDVSQLWIRNDVSLYAGADYAELGFVNNQIGPGLVNSFYLDESPNPIPEPSTILLLGTGLLGFAVICRKKLLHKT